MSNELGKELIVYEQLDMKELENIGRKHYFANDEIRNFANVINHPECVKVFENFFYNKHGCQEFIVYYKIFEAIRKANKREMNSFQMLGMFFKILENKKLFSKIISEIKI